MPGAMLCAGDTAMSESRHSPSPPQLRDVGADISAQMTQTLNG